VRRVRLVLLALALLTVGCTPTFLTSCGGGRMGRMEASTRAVAQDQAAVARHLEARGRADPLTIRS